MKWAWLIAGAVLLGILFALPGTGPSSDVPPESPAPAVAPVAITQPLPQATPAAARPVMVLRGLIYRGKDSKHSQALLAVDGRPQQALRAGDPIDRGWSLKTIAPDHVLVANGAATARLEVTTAAAASPFAAATPATAKTVATTEAPLPGFAPGPRPRAAMDAATTERNRRFLQDSQSRRAARP
jgi:hypothetical protein